MAYGMSAPAINPNTFPYLKRFSKREIEELLARIDRLRFILTDPVGPSGVTTYLDDGTIANIAFHAALAGCDTHDDERRLIWADVSDDESKMFKVFNWKLIKDEQPPVPEPPDPDVVAQQAAMAKEQIDTQLPPEVRRALLKTLAKEFERDTTEEAS
jgi:hypothetical protein